ncbi:hypothetical protein KAR52_02065 [Candidatus Pacearchaeota archaeon]|nr:hypothetical protein [Candidatus Pacearchaeota archaeon]
MVFTPVEIIALILIIIATIKILVLLIKPQAWMNFAQCFYKKPIVARTVSLVLGGVIFYYLITAGISVVEILAVTAFVAMLMVFGLASQIKPLIAKYKAQIKKGKLWKDNWLYTLLWIALMVWGILVLFNLI